MAELYRSHVISWNITQRCNLECEHCYIDARPMTKGELSGEMSTEECLNVVDQICEMNPNALLILTGGEPFLRADVFEIAAYASQRGLWVVVGTNGILINDRLIDRMIENGIKGLSLSLDALNPEDHDRFRGVKGAWKNTVQGSRLLSQRQVPYIIQTTVGSHNQDDLEAIAAMAFELGAKVFNVYFLVATGRGQFLTDISPQAYESIMARLAELQVAYDTKMVLNMKCAPHYLRLLYESDPESKFLKGFDKGAGGCPAGTHYCGIRPNGDMTPCPYLPVFGGNLRQTSFSEIWNRSPVFTQIRDRNRLQGRCGSCEFSHACGGCRARSYGYSFDVMAEDPWCTYEPGRHGTSKISFATADAYGQEATPEIQWTQAARERLLRIPSFVRGRVVRKVEDVARDRGVQTVTPELMHEIRQRTFGDSAVPAFLFRDKDS